MTTVTATLLISACGKSSPKASQSVTVNNDESSVENRVTVSNQTIDIIPSEGTTQLAAINLGYILTQSAEILPPTINGVHAQANAVALNNQGLAVAYNVAGDVQAGAIDIVNIEGKTAKIKSDLEYATRDINSIFWGKSAIYAVGTDSTTGQRFLSRIRVDGA